MAGNVLGVVLAAKLRLQGRRAIAATKRDEPASAIHRRFRRDFVRCRQYDNVAAARRGLSDQRAEEEQQKIKPLLYGIG